MHFKELINKIVINKWGATVLCSLITPDVKELRRKYLLPPSVLRVFESCICSEQMSRESATQFVGTHIANSSGWKREMGKCFFFKWEEHGYTRYILSVGKSSLNRIWESDFSFFFYSVARFVENIGKVKSYATAKFAVQGWVSGASLEFHSFTIQRSDGERMQAARCGGSVVDNGLHELSHTTVIDLT